MRTALSLLGIAAALLLCGVSVAMNYLFLSSLGKTPLEGQVLGAASAAADILKSLLPFFIAWSWRARRWIATVCGVCVFVFIAGFSLMSALGFAADNRGVLVETRDTLNTELKQRERALEEMEARRLALPRHRALVVVTEDLERHKQSRRWDATKGCQNATETESRSYCEAYYVLRAELAAGREADKLAAEMKRLQQAIAALRLRGAGFERDPQVSILSRIFGHKPEPMRLALIIAVALLVEIGSSLGLFLASGHGAAFRKRENTAAKIGKDQSVQPALVQSDRHQPLGCVETFCLEALIPAENGTLGRDELCQLYETWCQSRAQTPLAREAFTSVFTQIAKAAGIARRRGFWQGLAAKR